MDKKECYIIDINTILSFEDRMVWIIDRMNPSIPIIRISESEYNLIKSEIYKSKNNKIYFNGVEYFISEDLINKIKVKSKVREFNLTNLSFSMREYLDPQIIENLKPIIDLSPIKEMKNKSGDIYLIISNYMKSKYQKQIDKLIEKMSEQGYKIKGFYWLDQTFNSFEKDNNLYKKELIILSHIIGKKIKDGKISDEDYPQYNIINYYDSSSDMVFIDFNNINLMLKKLLIDVKDKKSLVFNKVILNFNKVTSNLMNRLIKSTIEIVKDNI